MPAGSLTVLGTGIKLGAHLSREARAHIQQAEKVIVGAADDATRAWIGSLNPAAEPLSTYLEGKPRRATYEAWVDRILGYVRAGLRVCAVFYGHPGVFVFAGHEAVRRAREEGYAARMLPAISAEDCLFADLGVDPGRCGCQSFEATDFLIHGRRFDPTSALVLWQLSVTGELGSPTGKPNRKGLAVLRDVLAAEYGGEHEVVVYEAAAFALLEPVIQRLPLAELDRAEITDSSTLYVPPKREAKLVPGIVERLGIRASDLHLHLADRRPAGGTGGGE